MKGNAHGAGKANPQCRNWVRFVYDSNYNLVEIREYHPSIKKGSKRVRLTELKYDSNYNLTRIAPNYDTDVAVDADLDP